MNIGRTSKRGLLSIVSGNTQQARRPAGPQARSHAVDTLRRAAPDAVVLLVSVDDEGGRYPFVQRVVSCDDLGGSARTDADQDDSAVKARTQAINQLKAVLVIADPALRERLSGLGNRELFRTCARLSPSDGDDEDTVPQATRITLSLLAQRIEQHTRQIDELNLRLTRLVERHAPQLLTPVGIGPDSAVTLLITMGDNPERLSTEASFAALCGSPIEYLSGRRSSRRLNHGGDRQANAALHRIVFTRLRFDPRTQEYYERRTQECKTCREIIRCLKRYAAREVFHLVRPVSTGLLS